MWAVQVLAPPDNQNTNTRSDRHRTAARSLPTIRRTNHADVAGRAAVDRATIRQFGIKADNPDHLRSADQDSLLSARQFERCRLACASTFPLTCCESLSVVRRTLC